MGASRRAKRRSCVAVALAAAIALMAAAGLFDQRVGEVNTVEAYQGLGLGEQVGEQSLLPDGDTPRDLLPNAGRELLEGSFGPELTGLLGQDVTRRQLSCALEDAALETLETYEGRGDCVLAQAGYLDYVGNVWACTVQGDGWVEVAVVREGPKGASELTTVHMDAQDWERELRKEGMEEDGT